MLLLHFIRFIVKKFKSAIGKFYVSIMYISIFWI